MRVVGINGSPRKNGNTSKMVNSVLEILKSEGCSTEIIELAGKKVQGCIGCYRCAQNKNRQCSIDTDDFNPILKKMIEADGIILGSPTYFTDITSELKALIDRSGFVARTNGNLFKHKVGAAVVMMRRAGGIHAFDSINHLFQISQMFIVGSIYWNIALGSQIGEVDNDEEGVKTMQELGHSMSFLLHKLA